MSIDKTKPYLIVMASKLEAKDFFEHVDSQQEQEEPFPLWSFSWPGQGEVNYFTISGIGPYKTEETLEKILELKEWNFVLNIGVAGALIDDLKKGDVCVIDSVSQVLFDPLDEEEPGEESFSTQAGLGPAYPELGLVSVDEPVTDAGRRQDLALKGHLVDMEGFTVAMLCSLFDLPCYMFKVVSDFADEKAKKDVYAGLSDYSRIIRDVLITIFEEGQEEVLP